MARPTFITAVLVLVIILVTMVTVGCGPQRVLPTLPPQTPLPTMTELATSTVSATNTRTVAPSETPTVAPTSVPTSVPTSGSPSATPGAKPSPTRAPIPTSGMMQIKLFFVAVNDNGKSGKKIGCDDSLVAVNRQIPATSAPLTAAVKELLAQHDQFIGQSGLYNALYQSKLQVGGISISNAKATINLTGTLTLGGVCDSPRVAAQLEQVALQFPTVTQVAILVNGVPLDKLLSGK